MPIYASGADRPFQPSPADNPENVFPLRLRGGRPMDDTRLMGVIREFEQESYGFVSGQLASARAYAVERYLALPYGNEVEGRSSVVDTGLRDTIEWLLPPILRVFLSGQRVVEFEPTGPEDEAAARQETEYVNYVMLEKNDAFNVFSTWFRDALMAKVGYVKASWRVRRDVLQERYKGLTDDQLMILQADPAVELMGAPQSYPDPFFVMPPMPAAPAMQGGMQPPQRPMLHDVAVRRVKAHGFVVTENVPPEEIYVHRSTRTTSVADSQFVQHRALRTLSQLRQDGYDVPDDVPESGDEAGEISDQIVISRDRFADDLDIREGYSTGNVVDPAARRVWFRESYLRVDYDGDGIAELRKVCHVGQHILANDELDLIPFAAITPIVFPHRHVGVGYDDLCDVPSKVKTAVLRGYLDNLYLANNGRYAVDVNAVNVDDMLVSRPGGVVRTQGAPGNAILPLQHVAAGADALQGLEFASSWMSNSTGVTPDQSDMSADVLKGNTATGISAAVSAGQSRVESVTRSFASGVKDLFGIVHALTLKNATSDEKIKLNGQWVTIDPREWVKRTAMTITVGIGTGTKETRIAQYQMLAQMQAQGLQIGICQPQNLYETGKRIVEEMGHRNVDAFLTDPSRSPPQPPQPPPEVQAEQIRAQSAKELKQMDLEADAQKFQAETQQKAASEQMEAQSNAASDAARAQADVAVAQHKASVESQLEVQRVGVDDAKHAREQETAVRIAEINAASRVEAARITAMIKSEQGNPMVGAYTRAAGVLGASDPGQEAAPNPLVDAINQSHQALAQHIAQGHAELKQVLTAPKRIVRDQSGRAIGVEAVPPQGA